MTRKSKALKEHIPKLDGRCCPQIVHIQYEQRYQTGNWCGLIDVE